ncbi:MAG: nitroreductase family deazaflavin-dependent oxidoreductase [Nocardioidaceae bacterium]|nr:nitroreductase family deazaflavin-dependent oxidoreductase [Nocardioidaceae bacterium]
MGVFTPLAIRIGAIAWLPKFLPQITAFDRFLQRITRGHLSLLRLAGLPSMMLTVVGRKSGLVRTTPVLCVPYLRGFLVAGSNFGGAKAPVWVLNVRAAAERDEPVTIAVDRHTQQARPREITGPEREQVWAHMLKTWPNYAKYAERTDRVIPVFLFEPAA